MIGKSSKAFSVFYAHSLAHGELKGISNLAEFLLNYFVVTCLAILFWGKGPRGIVDTCLSLKGRWGADRTAFVDRLAEWVRMEFGHIEAIAEAFKFERDCWGVAFLGHDSDAENARPPSIAGALIEKLSAVRATRGSGVAWGFYGIAPRDAARRFAAALQETRESGPGGMAKARGSL